MESAPIRLSVVIVAWNGPESLSLCLRSLAGQLDPERSEIVVAANFPVHAVDDLPVSVSRFRSVSLPAGAAVPELRGKGLDHASGQIVAFLEDHCRCGEGWAAGILGGHESGYAIVGGAVENGPGQARLSWAVYFYDYGPYMLPDVARTVPALSGINVSYRRSVLAGVRARRDGFFETFINQDLQAQGYPLYFVPSAVVYHDKSYVFGSALADSYGFGKDFATRRVAGAPILRRLPFVGMSLLLPALQVARIVGRTVRKGRHLGKLVGCLPHIVVLMAAWSAGEFSGYLRGGIADAGGESPSPS
jgi:glycosyltransferase involved in cell wall biosynthesis